MDRLRTATALGTQQQEQQWQRQAAAAQPWQPADLEYPARTTYGTDLAHGASPAAAERSATTAADATAPRPVRYEVLAGRLVVPPRGEEMQEEIDRFIQTNHVNDGGIAEEALRREHWRTAKLAMGVIGGNSYRISAEEGDKTQIVLSRIRSARASTGMETPSGTWLTHNG